MDYVDDYLFDGEYLLLGEDGTVVTTDGFPVLQLVNDKFWVNNHAHVIRGKGNISTRFLYLMFVDSLLLVLLQEVLNQRLAKDGWKNGKS